MKSSDHGGNFHRASLLSEFIPPHEFIDNLSSYSLLLHANFAILTEYFSVLFQYSGK